MQKRTRLMTLAALVSLTTFTFAVDTTSSLTCPLTFNFSCAKVVDGYTWCAINDNSTPVASEWRFAAPILQSAQNMDIAGHPHGSLSILPPGNYSAAYALSVSGTLTNLGPDDAYCMYQIENTQSGIYIAGLYSQFYHHGQGAWLSQGNDTYTCQNAANCGFSPKTTGAQ